MSNKQPTHNVFVVREGKKEDKSYWTKVGAAWKHSDDDGLYIKLDFPVGVTELTIRKIKEEPTQ